MNWNKIEFMCFKQNGVISKLNNKSWKLIDHFTYLGHKISSAKNNVKKGMNCYQQTIDHIEISSS